MSTIVDGDAPERCPNCLHGLNLEGFRDEDCECYCHKALEEMEEWLWMIEGRRE